MTIEEYLKKLIVFIGIDEAEFSIEKNETPVRVEFNITVPEEKASIFIGNKGAELESLQHLLRITFREQLGEQKIAVDINQYRHQKEDRILSKAKEVAAEVLATGQARIFRHLNSYERYLVHQEISAAPEFSELETASFDEEDQRVLKISKKS